MKKKDKIDPLECDCCQYPAKKLHRVHPQHPPAPRPINRLCGICFRAMVGVYVQYPNQHDADALKMMKHVSYVGNVILTAIAAPAAKKARRKTP